MSKHIRTRWRGLKARRKRATLALIGEVENPDAVSILTLTEVRKRKRAERKHTSPLADEES